jgi:hypothetical protein
MDQWLTWTFLEGGGGGQGSESYELGLYCLARHTALDSWEKRKKRGFVFMTGDENFYPHVSKDQVNHLIGDGLTQDIPTPVVVEELQRTFEPFFLIPDQKRRDGCERSWRDLLGDHVICMDDADDTCHTAAGIVALSEGSVKDLDALAERLRQSGVPDKRVASVARALTPFAATLRRDGTPVPKLDKADLPAGDGASGHKRR